jgi:hypothetical protein
MAARAAACGRQMLVGNPRGSRISCAAVTVSRETIAACLIVKDEQARLPAALDSVAFCDEVIVVDSGSRDRTVEVATGAGARVVEHPWEGFGKQRNVAVDQATADWILEVDADERITPELARELLAFLGNPPAEVAIGALPMREWFLGRLLGPSIKYPRYRTRLFRRGAYRHDERRAVHEGVWPAGPTWAASGDMHHVLADSLGEALIDWWRYARLESSHVGRPVGVLGNLRAIVVRPTVKLAYRMLVDGGWRDGPVGMLKILLDCGGDSLVWLLRFSRRDQDSTNPFPHGAAEHLGALQRPGVSHDPGVSQDRGALQDVSEHFGRNEPHRGPVRLVAVAAGVEGTQAAVRWLARARDAGADVALVTDQPANGDASWLFTVACSRRTPFSIMRALDAVEQVRPFDCIVASGGSRRVIERFLPRARRGPAALESLEDDPVTVVARVTARVRPHGAEPAPGVPAR